MEGFVAFLDILGFSELVRNGNLFEKFPQYTDIINNALETEGDLLQYIIFSDSIIINSKNAEEDTLLLLSTALSKISYQLLLKMNMPICGCVSMGEYSRLEKEGNVTIAGPPILDAYHYEQEQDWIGIMLSPTILRRGLDIPTNTFIGGIDSDDRLDSFMYFLPWMMCLQRNEKINFHGEREFDGFAIVPSNITTETIEELHDDLFNYWYHLENLKFLCRDPQSQSKYDQTMSWIESVGDQ